jgi:hypothetical protein
VNGTTVFSEVLEARIRRKSQNLKDLFANFWVPPNNKWQESEGRQSESQGLGSYLMGPS